MWKILIISFLLYVQGLEFDCDAVGDLCPGQMYTMACNFSIDEGETFLFHSMTIKKGNKKLEFDIKEDGEVVGSEFILEKSVFGKITGNATKQDNSSSMWVSFKATEFIDKSRVSCQKDFLDTAGQHQVKNQTCHVRLASNPPQPVQNLSISDCSPYIFWERPLSKGRANEQLTYKVSITSSKTNVTEYIVPREFLKLRPHKYDANVAYNVCVSAINCIGEGPLVCEEFTRLRIHPPAPDMNVTIINNTAVEVSWTVNTTKITKPCFDIELNYKIIDTVCPLAGENRLEVDMKNSTKELMHTFRVRESISHGEWSKPVCVLLAPPLPALITNHSVSRSVINSNTILNLSIQVLDESQVVGPACQVALVRSVEISIEGSRKQTFEVSMNEIKTDKNSFDLGQENKHLVRVRAKAVSKVGKSPEHVTEVYLDNINGSVHRVAPSALLLALLIAFVTCFIG